MNHFITTPNQKHTFFSNGSHAHDVAAAPPVLPENQPWMAGRYGAGQLTYSLGDIHAHYYY